MNPRFDLRQMRYFVAVADTLSFSRAAERLHISQPPLSRQIRELETRLGMRLFERNTRSVKLTAAGETALRRAHRILADIEAFGAELAELRDASLVRVGVTMAITVAVHKRLEEAWKAALGGRTRLRVEIAKTNVLVAQLRRRELDFALFGGMYPPVEGFERMLLHEIPLVAAMRPGHSATQKKVVSLRDLGDGPVFWLRRSFSPYYFDHCQKVFDRAGFRPRFIYIDPGQLETLARVAQGEGSTLVRRSQVEMLKGLVWRPLKEGTALAIQVEAVWPRNGSDLPRARRNRLLRETARKVLREHEHSG